MTILVVNCCGLGDGFVALPFLKALEETAPPPRYFHTDGAIFRYPFLANLNSAGGCAGIAPAHWRKFYEPDFANIAAFLTANDIDAVVNLRLLGPVHDQGYFAFQQYCNANMRFANFDFEDTGQRTDNIRQRIARLFSDCGLIDQTANPLTLSQLLPRRAKRIAGRIGININTGNALKEWPLSKWSMLCKRLLRMGYTITIFGGYTHLEIERSQLLTSELQKISPGALCLVAPFEMTATLYCLEELECLITTDSWLVHAASGLDIPCVALYITTSAQIWSGAGVRSVSLQSPHLQRCMNFDALLGICRNQYRKCDLLTTEGDGVSPNEVIEAMQKVMLSTE